MFIALLETKNLRNGEAVQLTEDDELENQKFYILRGKYTKETQATRWISSGPYNLPIALEIYGHKITEIALA